MILSDLYASFAGATSDSDLVFEYEGNGLEFGNARVEGGTVFVTLIDPPAPTEVAAPTADAAPADVPADAPADTAPPVDPPASADGGDTPAS